MSHRTKTEREIGRNNWSAQKFFVFSICLVFSLIFVNNAEADTVFLGLWSDFQADGDNPVVSGIGTDTLVWGDPGDFGVGPSSAAYSDYSVLTEDVLSGQPFAIGNITYFNGTIAEGTGISGATLFLTALSDFDDLDGDEFPLSMFTESTPNKGSPMQNADYLFFSNMVDDPLLPEFFNVLEGGTASADIFVSLELIPGGYQLDVLGFGNVQGDGFLTENAIPEPSSGLIVLMGAWALGIRKKRSN